jgi:hypothetical protein
MKLRGRHWLGFWLVLFLGTAAAVVTRQRAALLTARRLGTLRDSTTNLDATKSDLLRQINSATSRAVLVPKMERAGFHQPSEFEDSPLPIDTLTGGAPRRR